MKISNILIIAVFLFTTMAHAKSSEITDKKTLEFLQEVTVAMGYVCPRVALAYNKGYVHRGVQIKYWCGPESGGAYENLVYSLIINAETGDPVSLTPWQK